MHSDDIQIGRKYFCAQGRHTRDCIVKAKRVRDNGHVIVEITAIIPSDSRSGEPEVGQNWSCAPNWIHELEDKSGKPSDPNILFRMKKKQA